jgi:hypothetical protein
MKKYLILAFIVSAFLSSCIVQAPKFTMIEDVLSLQVGMTKDEISTRLGIPPYDIKYATDSTSKLIYKYRTTDRKTVPFFLKRTNGVKARGKWVDLFVTYDKEGKATAFNSCSDCEETKVSEKKINYTAILQTLSTTVPAVLVYFGLKAN